MVFYTEADGNCYNAIQDLSLTGLFIAVTILVASFQQIILWNHNCKELPA
jgi:hypothetical protein